VHGVRATASAALFATVLGAAATGSRTPPVPPGSRCGEPTELETSLARAPILYAVVDGPARRIELRARAVVLRRFALRDMSSIGRAPPPAGPWRLVTKRPLIEPVPRRPRPPGLAAAGEDTDDLRPLTVKEMPARYQLAFDGGLSILVHSGGATARWQRLLERFGALTDRISGWATVLAGRVVEPQRRVLIVELTAEESRALYWAIRPTLPVLLRVICPSGEAVPARDRDRVS
jgi:hypothetical protein